MKLLFKRWITVFINGMLHNNKSDYNETKKVATVHLKKYLYKKHII